MSHQSLVRHLSRAPLLRSASPASLSRSASGLTGPDPIRCASPPLRATVFGAYGFVGNYVVSKLAAEGIQCVIPWRGDDMEWRHLKVHGDIGVVAPVPFSPRDDDSIKRVVEGSDIVINLMGKDYETRHFFGTNFKFEDVHVTLAEKIAAFSVAAGATTFVHMSALAADPNSLSAWARSKALGEEAVRAVCPGATVVRPADVVGPEDRFLNLFARMYGLFQRVPLIAGGTARVQPLYVLDLARAIHTIATSEDEQIMLGQTYDLAGPEEYTIKEIVEYVFESIRADAPEVINVSPSTAALIGNAIGVLPSPLITADRFLRFQSDVVLDELSPSLRLHDLGIEATSMEMPGFNFLHMYRTGSHFVDLPGRKKEVARSQY